MDQPGRVRLDATPGLAVGCAAGDVVEVGRQGEFVVIARGGNLGIQVLAPAAAAHDFSPLASRVSELGGYLDGGRDTQAGTIRVFTVPVAAGFAAVEDAFESFCRAHPGVTWSYTNVYEPGEGATPLLWWET